MFVGYILSMLGVIAGLCIHMIDRMMNKSMIKMDGVCSWWYIGRIWFMVGVLGGVVYDWVVELWSVWYVYVCFNRMLVC